MFKTILRLACITILAVAVSSPLAHAKQRLLMGTSTGGGSYYVLGGTWSNELNNKLGDILDLSIEVTGGPETNIMLIENKEMDLGMVTAWQAGDMYNGQGKNPKKFQSMRAFIPLYPSYLQIYALSESGLKSVHDIDGKTASSGPAGASSFLAARAIIDTLGLKPAITNRAAAPGACAQQRTSPVCAQENWWPCAVWMRRSGRPTHGSANATAESS